MISPRETIKAIIIKAIIITHKKICNLQSLTGVAQSKKER